MNRLPSILVCLALTLAAPDAFATNASGLFATAMNNLTGSVSGVLGGVAFFAGLITVIGALTSKGQGFVASFMGITAICAVGALLPTILGWVGITSSLL